VTYSSTLALGRANNTRSNSSSRQRFGQRNQNSTSFRATTRTIGPVSNTIILIVLACVLGLLYLTQVTKTNAFGYRINGLQDQQTSLKQQHDDLAVTAARSQSVDRVQNSDVAKALVSVAPSTTIQN
jgi:hypothetical protein